ncbi:MAG: glycosyltransferase family 2 protein [Candidatus Omnitrophica bacterium]|nr:glycosyltransferase family 2 protein [Candidatus Omnitrophota bacterium]
MNKSDLVVLIPTFNESQRIGSVVSAIRDHGYSVLVVDDGSSDDTAEEARRFGAEVLTSPVNHGKGATLTRGFDYFLGKDHPVLVIMDGDGQHDPQELDRFLEAMNSPAADVVVGNRMQNPEGMPWERRLTNRLMSWVISKLAGQTIPDSQCGYRALKREVLTEVALRSRRFEIESEMLLEAAKAGFRIASIPVRSVYGGEKSQIRPFSDTCRFLRFLILYFFRENFSKKHKVS